MNQAMQLYSRISHKITLFKRCRKGYTQFLLFLMDIRLVIWLSVFWFIIYFVQFDSLLTLRSWSLGLVEIQCLYKQNINIIE